MTTDTPFDQTRLLTPGRIAQDPYEAFSTHPAWVRLLTIFPAVNELPDSERFGVVLLGHKKRVSSWATSLPALALLFELTRLPGMSATVNSNGTGRLYPRLTINDHPEDLTSISRLLTGAGPDDQVKTGVIRSDLRLENLHVTTAEKTGKEAREVVMHHATRLARDWEAGDTMPAHLTAESYLHNLERLFDALDQEAAEFAAAA